MGSDKLMNIDVSVCILTYNPDVQKLLMTIISVLSQKSVLFEIIVADDGSADCHADEIEEVMRRFSFSNYRLLKSRNNKGTVKNTYDAISRTGGRYIKLLSPGDFFSYENALHDLVEYMDRNQCYVCFSDAVYYDNKRTYRHPVKVFYQPQEIGAYKRKDTYCQKIHYLVLNDRVCGATWFARSDLVKRYIKLILNKVIYCEDSIYRIMVLDGVPITHFERETIFYEYGSGISTSESNKWTRLLNKDDVAANEVLLTHCKKDLFGKRYNLFLHFVIPGNTFRNNIAKVFVFPESFFMWLGRRSKRRVTPIQMDYSFADQCQGYIDDICKNRD